MDEEKIIRLDQTRKVFKVLADLIQTKETCSYRYLIYDLLGFEDYAYTMLLDGLAITNHLVEYEELEDKLKSIANIIDVNVSYEEICQDKCEGNDTFYENVLREKDVEIIQNIIRGKHNGSN